MDKYPEHTNKANELAYDTLLLLCEKERMREEHNQTQKDLPKPIPFDEWYDRVWKQFRVKTNQKLRYK